MLLLSVVPMTVQQVTWVSLKPGKEWNGRHLKVEMSSSTLYCSRPLGTQSVRQKEKTDIWFPSATVNVENVLIWLMTLKYYFFKENKKTQHVSHILPSLSLSLCLDTVSLKPLLLKSWLVDWTNVLWLYNHASSISFLRIPRAGII